jgi:DNA polymerase-1
VNFGIIYGQTAFGLARTIQISRAEADKFINAYFKVYQGVKQYIDRTIAEARETGMCRTLFNRQRQIPDMKSRNPNARSFAERTAVNSPLQGTAADLIKMAMVRVDRALTAESLQARLLLQVHDELLFEAPPEEVEAVRSIAKREMEGVYQLSVPLVVDVGVGENWRDAK